MRTLPIIVLMACIWQSGVRGQGDGETRAAPSRGILKRGLLAKGKQTTTTTTTSEPQEEVEFEDEAEHVDEAQERISTEAPPQVSTEGKKLVAGGVRPFRSNADLLEALKRRRTQAAEAKLQGHSSIATKSSAEAPTEAPSKSSYSKKRFNSSLKERNIDEVPEVSVKPGRGKFTRPPSRSMQEAETEEQNEFAPALVPARTGRTFYRRGGN